MKGKTMSSKNNIKKETTKNYRDDSNRSWKYPDKIEEEMKKCKAEIRIITEEIKTIIKKHKLENYHLHFQKCASYGIQSESSLISCSNEHMAKTINEILFKDKNFRMARNTIMSNVFDYFNPFRDRTRINENGEFVNQHPKLTPCQRPILTPLK